MQATPRLLLGLTVCLLPAAPTCQNCTGHPLRPFRPHEGHIGVAVMLAFIGEKFLVGHRRQFLTSHFTRSVSVLVRGVVDGHHAHPFNRLRCLLGYRGFSAEGRLHVGSPFSRDNASTKTMITAISLCRPQDGNHPGRQHLSPTVGTTRRSA